MVKKKSKKFGEETKLAEILEYSEGRRILLKYNALALVVLWLVMKLDF